jgi:hypothetical protein
VTIVIVARRQAAALEYCRDLHDRFWKARRGKAMPIAA